jgi:hypothetical protein
MSLSLQSAVRFKYFAQISVSVTGKSTFLKKGRFVYILSFENFSRKDNCYYFPYLGKNVTVVSL